MISIESLTFQYEDRAEPALKDITLDIEDGGFVGVIGPAGAGKTTLARAISSLVPHHYKGDFYGSVTVDSMDTVDHKLTDISRIVGMVFQDVESQIISSIVEDEILYGLENFGIPHEEIEGRVSFALKEVGIEDLRHRTIASLSGGQRQKVAIASVIALRPRVLMLDEPTGELDPGSSRQVFSLLKTLNEKYGLTVIIIEQKIMLLSEFVKDLTVMSKGTVFCHGPVREVLKRAKELLEIGVNCPRVASLAQNLHEAGLTDTPVLINVDEAETLVRRLIS